METVNNANVSSGVAVFKSGGAMHKIEALDHEIRAWFEAWCAEQAHLRLDRRRRYMDPIKFQQEKDELDGKIAGGLFAWTYDDCSPACKQALKTFDGLVERIRLQMERINTPAPDSVAIRKFLNDDGEALIRAMRLAEGAPVPNADGPGVDQPSPPNPGQSDGASSDQPATPGKESPRS